MKLILFFSLLLLNASAWAQYQVKGCKSKELVDQLCIFKNFQASDKFDSGDLLELKNFVASHPGLPWMNLLDSDRKLSKELAAGTGKIKGRFKARYLELLAKIKVRPDPEAALEAASILLSNVPLRAFFLNTKDKSLMRQFVDVLATTATDNTEISSFNYQHCAVNHAKLKAALKDRDRCSNLEDSANSSSFYTALAELISCDNYGIESIRIQEQLPEEGVEAQAPCAVTLRDVSASVGKGIVEIKINGNLKKLEWSAGHDLSGTRNDLKYWRDQLEPQFIKSKNQLPVAEKLPALNED